MKKLSLVVLLLAVVACAPGQSAQSVMAPSVENAGGSVTVAGRPHRAKGCDPKDAFPDVLVCDIAVMAQGCSTSCQVCDGASFAILNCSR